ncbi:hypothetical protein TNCV_272921 [Trichonephila clavipes]|nr:hypothetical protein TNCV_272921 [Trichonephila clavipes]
MSINTIVIPHELLGSILDAIHPPNVNFIRRLDCEILEEELECEILEVSTRQMFSKLLEERVGCLRQHWKMQHLSWWKNLPSST